MPTESRTPRFRLPTWALPSDTFTVRQRRIVILIGLASMASAFINTLFTQTVAFAADEFNISTGGQGVGASIVRLGIVLCIPLVAMADKRGRRPIMVATAWAAPVICALGALSPNFSFLVATQSVGRPLGLTLDILIAVVAVEEMPRNSRAYATGLLAVLSGIGAGVAVAALPLADISASSWRYIYAISLVWLVVAVALTRWLPESQRFEIQPDRHSYKRHLTSSAKHTLVRICSVVFLTNIFIATMSIFQNRYLKDSRGYSATLVALFTVATSSPASIGLVLGGRVADERGRRLLGSTLVPCGVLLLALSFATSGIAMWSVAIAGGLCLGASYPALAVYRGELFPTRIRGVAGGLIMTASLMGGIIGLLVAGWSVDAGLSYGTVLLILTVFPIVASLMVWRHYPETAHLELEEITSNN